MRSIFTKLVAFHYISIITGVWPHNEALHKLNVWRSVNYLKILLS